MARALVAAATTSRALVRDPAAPLPDGVEPVRGRRDRAGRALPAAVEGCELVFNAMGIPEQWLADEDAFERVNARGTEAVVRAAVAAGVRRVVHTSTIDVFHAEPRRALRRVEPGRLPEGHGLRALEAARPSSWRWPPPRGRAPRS